MDSGYLIEQIERANNYLIQQSKTNPDYSKLIESLNLTTNRLKSIKPIVKIVSPSATLAEDIKAKSLTDSKLRSLYEFQTVSPIGKIEGLIQNCDLICLVYYFQQSIHQHHRRAIELARQDNISSILLVIQPKRNVLNVSQSDWLREQNYSFHEIFVLSDLIDLDCQQHVNAYQQLLLQLLETAKYRFTDRCRQDIQTNIEDFFQGQKICVRQAIAQSEPSCRSDKPLHYYRQQLDRIYNQAKQEKQQTTTAIKQNLNYLKLDLLNPFIAKSLTFSVRQLVDRAGVQAVREAKNTYLYLTLDDSPHSEYIHDYIVELCQRKITEIIAFQWWQINHVYAEGGLHNLVDKINAQFKTHGELSDLNCLYKPTDNLQTPSFNLLDIIDRECLKSNSRILFDYNFTQSSWFRLLTSLLIGWGIYLVTWIYLGDGKYIGFVIIIFQIINLITGNDTKKIKLRQQTKELKRTVDRQYQTLVRLAIDKSIQTLITAVDRESQSYQLQLERAIATAQTHLEPSQQAIARHQSKIDNLERDRSIILSWFNSTN